MRPESPTYSGNISGQDTGMANSPFIIEVTRENYEQVMQASFETPVLMDFWASWCQPCQVLMPVLARLAEEYEGKFLLAKLNTEENQEIAAQFGIRSIPTVKLFRDGQPVDEFMGALPEQAVRDFLDKHIPDEEKAAEEKARKMQFFETQLANAPDASELEVKVAEDPDDHEALYQLALCKVVEENFDAAVDLLLQLMQKDRGYGDDAGRHGLLKIFELLGDDPRVTPYRRRMTSLLY
jgi:putative thioredoxin